MAVLASPTRIRQQVRDLVDADTAPLAGRLEAVRTLVGYRVQLDLEWAMLWATLQPCYPDPATFVPSIVAITTAWCDSFTAWIESDDNTAAVERLLEAMASQQALRLSVEVWQPLLNVSAIHSSHIYTCSIMACPKSPD